MSDNVYTVNQGLKGLTPKPTQDTPEEDVWQGRCTSSQGRLQSDYPTLGQWLDARNRAYLLGIDAERDRIVESFEEWSEETMYDGDSVRQFIDWHLGA